MNTIENSSVHICNVKKFIFTSLNNAKIPRNLSGTTTASDSRAYAFHKCSKCPWLLFCSLRTVAKLFYILVRAVLSTSAMIPKGKKDIQWKTGKETRAYSENKSVLRRWLRFLYIQSGNLACWVLKHGFDAMIRDKLLLWGYLWQCFHDRLCVQLTRSLKRFWTITGAQSKWNHLDLSLLELFWNIKCFFLCFG